MTDHVEFPNLTPEAMSANTSAKERPILFKGEMVRAILDGSKTQTRRVVKRQGYMKFDQRERPFGRPADRLWVRETFCIESSKYVAYKPPHSDGRPIRHHQDDEWGPWWEQPHYRATDPAPELDIGTDEPGCRWRSSIFMPRWASRILLEITATRVERLQSISGPDCWAEGIAYSGWDPERYGSVVECYRNIWESIHGTVSWATNPWVWVVEFRRVQP